MVQPQAAKTHDSAKAAGESRPAGRFRYASGDSPLAGYEIKRGVGAGGFGEVYFALSDAGKEVALKHIERNLEVELRGVRQCLNLKHPNLMALHDIRRDDHGEYWIVMEYVEGENLSQAIARHGQGMPVEEVRAWLLGIAAGVAYLHDHGIVHRDLKPGNIFSDGGIIKIGDYGLSKFISCSRRSGQTESVGTFHYMAPEIGRGSYGKEIDIYALGCVMLEMLTGQPPFDGESSHEIIMKHLTADPPLEGVPEPFRTVIGQCLAKDPARRPASVAQVLARLGLELNATWAGPTLGGGAASGAIDLPETEYRPAAAIESQGDATTIGPPREGGEPPEVAAGAATHEKTADTEPVARFVQAGARRVGQWWKNSSLSTPFKVVLLILATLVVVSSLGGLITLALVLGAAYAVYLLVRRFVRAHLAKARLAAGGASPPAAGEPGSRDAAGEGTAGSAGATAESSAPASRSRRRSSCRRRWREAARAELAAKPALQRGAELTGSLLVAAAACLVLSLVMMIMGGKALDADWQTWVPTFTWFAAVSIVATWALLIVSKFWEGSQGDQAPRRFAMLVIGLAVGAAAYGLDRTLLADFDQRLALNLPDDHPANVHGLSDALYSAATPLLGAFLAYFAALFAVLRWWTQADPLRFTRLSVWATLGCVLAAWLIHLFWPFPQPWGMMLAVTISISVQLAAPWISETQRDQLRRDGRLTSV